MDDYKMDAIGRVISFLDDFGPAVEALFEAYDDMCESDRKRLVRFLSYMRFTAALNLVRNHASFKKASEDVHFERTPIVDEETGRSFVTVEGVADPDMQDHFRNMRPESVPGPKNKDFSIEQILGPEDRLQRKEESNQ